MFIRIILMIIVFLAIIYFMADYIRLARKSKTYRNSKYLNGDVDLKYPMTIGLLTYLLTAMIVYYMSNVAKIDINTRNLTWTILAPAIPLCICLLLTNIKKFK